MKNQKERDRGRGSCVRVLCVRENVCVQRFINRSINDSFVLQNTITTVHNFIGSFALSVKQVLLLVIYNR